MLLDRRKFFVKEHVALVKLTDTYDILDPESGRLIGVAREEPATWAKYARLFVKKDTLPTTVNVYEGDSEGAAPLVSIHKGHIFFGRKVLVTDGKGNPLGHFQRKFFSLGVSFDVYDAGNQRVAEVKGDWKGWNFRFLDAGGGELGVVTKTWAGLGKEFFTSADHYMIALSDHPGAGPAAAALLLAAGLAIDVLFKEAK